MTDRNRLGAEAPGSTAGVLYDTGRRRRWSKNRWRMAVLSSSLAALLLVIHPVDAQGQWLGLPNVFSKVSDINTGFGIARSLGSSDLNGDHMRTIGFEVSLLLQDGGHEAAVPVPTRELTIPCHFPSDSLGMHQDSVCREWRASVFQGFQVTDRVVKIVHGDTTTESHFTPKSAEKGHGYRPEIEIGISYNLITGFAGNTSDLDIRGTFEEFPVFATYIGFPFRDTGFTPYFAARAGISKLSGFRAYAPGGISDSVFSATGSTYLFGLGTGFAKQFVRGPYAYVEATVNYRHFNSVEWEATSGLLRPGLPRDLRISTFEVSVGMQIEVQEP